MTETEYVRENQILLDDFKAVSSRPFWQNFIKHTHPSFNLIAATFPGSAVDDYVAQVLEDNYGAIYLSHNALYGILDFPDVESKIAFILEWS